MNEQKAGREAATDDRRTRRTKRVLRQGLCALLLQKSLKDISVRELTDSVDLHRGTFYAHYRDIYDLYAQIQAEIVEEVNRILDEYALPQSDASTFPVILALIQYIYDNLDVCRMLLSENGDMTFVERLGELVRVHCLHAWMGSTKHLVEVRYEYYGCFVITGCIGMLRRWVQEGAKQPPQEIAEIIRQMTEPAVGLLGQLTRS